MGRKPKAKKTRTIKRVESTKPFSFLIVPQDLKEARCGDPSSCVIAKAIMRKLPKRAGILIQVGCGLTKILVDDTLTIYRTPAVLREALVGFDRTGKWGLRHGVYTLYAYASEQARKNRLKREAARAKARRANPRSKAETARDHANSGRPGKVKPKIVGRKSVSRRVLSGRFMHGAAIDI